VVLPWLPTLLAEAGLAVLVILGSLLPSRRLLPNALWLLVAGMAWASVLHSPIVVLQSARLLEQIGVFVVLLGVGEELGSHGHHPISALGLRVALVGVVVAGALAAGLTKLIGMGTAESIGLALAALPTSGALAIAVLEHARIPRASLLLVLQAAIADDLVSLLVLALTPIVLTVGVHPIALLATAVAVVVALVARRTTTGGLRALAALTVIASMLLGTSPALAGALAGALAHDLLPHHGLVVWVRRVLAAAFFAAAGYVGGSLEPIERVDLVLVAVLLLAVVASRLALGAAPGRFDPWLAVGMLPRGEVSLAIAVVLASELGPEGTGAIIGLVVASTLLGLLASRLLEANSARGGTTDRDPTPP